MVTDWSKYQVIDPAPGTGAIAPQPSPSPAPVDWSQYQVLPGDAPRSWSSIPASALQNIPASAIRAGKGIYTALSHPMDTLHGMADTAEGGIINGGRALFGQGFYLPGVSPEEEARSVAAADAFGNALKNRYGSVDALKNTLATDPVGAALDVAGALGIGGGVVKGAGATGIGNALAKASAYVDPISGPATMIGKVAESFVPSPEWLYRSALKPTLVPPSERSAMIKAGIDNRILPNEAGYWKANDIIANGGQQVNALVDSAAQNGVSIPVNPVAASVDNVLSKNVANPAELSGAAGVQQAFLDQYNPLHSMGVDSTIPVDVANELKRNTQGELKGRYGKDFTYTEEAKAALASALRKGIENAVPGVGPINAQIAPIMGLRDQLERASNRTGNYNVMGLEAPIVANAVAAAGGGAPGAAAAGFLTRLIGTNKARLAFAGDAARNATTQAAPFYTPGMFTRYPYMANQVTPNPPHTPISNALLGLISGIGAGFVDPSRTLPALYRAQSNAE